MRAEPDETRRGASNYDRHPFPTAVSLLKHIDDVRILRSKELAPPETVIAESPGTEQVAEFVFSTRRAIHDILHGGDDRLIVVIGPCSIHDVGAAMDYAKRLLVERNRLSDDLEVVMRVYFEKPRTTVGWKGLINDPHMDGSFAINDGLRIARRLLLDVNRLRLPAGTEFLDTISPQYVADLVSWGAIGARTTESQVHRELASGLSCPVGFKNGTGGTIGIAIDGVKAASQPHHFLSVTKSGKSAIIETAGNEDCHIILRGGRQPNYEAEHVHAAGEQMRRAGLTPLVMVDASHSNSRKLFEQQVAVCADVAGQIGAGDRSIIGVMIESFLVAGRQDHVPGRPLTYGQSITDACLGWDESIGLLDQLAGAVRARRRINRTRQVRAAAG